MKDEALALIDEINDPVSKLNILREYIQSYVLRSFHESEAFVNLSFVGGTALRFVFSLPRFSEDMDFSLKKKTGYKPKKWMMKIKHDLSLAGFNLSLTWNDRTTVHKAWIKISGLLKDAGLAAMSNQNLSVKLEIDTNPPKNALSVKTILTKYAVFAIQHDDLSSLMAGKIHALTTRKYDKGRDWYDLIWYLGQRPVIEPNLPMLQNALDQTQGKTFVKAEKWKTFLIKKLKNLNCQKLIEDVQPFLERPQEANLINAENIASLLK